MQFEKLVLRALYIIMSHTVSDPEAAATTAAAWKDAAASYIASVEA